MFLLFIVAVAAGTMPPEAVFAETENSINLGFGGVPRLMPHCKANVYILEYEHMLSGSKFTVFGRGSEVDYRFDDGIYVEEGKPRGADVGARYYLAGGMKGFSIGGSVGYWTADWTFINNKGTVYELRGRGENDSLRANIDIGGRFPIGSSSVSIVPAFNIGKYFSSLSCEYTAPVSWIGTACNQDTEVHAYMFLSVTVGIGF